MLNYNKPPKTAIENLLWFANNLTLDNNYFTKKTSTFDCKNNLIDKQICCGYITKYAEMIAYYNPQHIQEFLETYRGIKSDINLTEIDFNYSPKGDNGDLYWYTDNSKFLINVKSCPSNITTDIINNIKHKYGKHFMSLYYIVVREDMDKYHDKLVNLWVNNKSSFIDFVSNEIYKDITIMIGDTNNINSVTFC